MLKLTSKCLVLAMVVALIASAAFAEDKALLDLLVQKGILTNDEAVNIATEVKSTPAHPSPIFATGASRFIKKLTFSGRFQAQFAGIGESIDGAINPVSTEHFLLRRMYVGVKA